MNYFLVLRYIDSEVNNKYDRNKYVGVDHNSGGYPWAVGFDPTDNSVRKWRSIDEAKDYAKHNPGKFELVQIEWGIIQSFSPIC